MQAGDEGVFVNVFSSCEDKTISRAAYSAM